MGKVIAKKIRGMNLWAKVALTLLFTLTLSVFMYEGWYKPMQAQAAAVRYDVWPDTAAGSVGTDGSITFTTAVGTATSYTATGTANSARAMLLSGQTLASSIRNRIAGIVSTTAGWEFFRAYTPTYTTSNNAISANVAVNVRYYIRAAGSGTAQIIAELYEYNDTTGIVGTVKGTFTSTAFSLTATTTGADVTGNFGNSAFTVTPGNRLHVRFFVKPSVAQTAGSVAILWGATSTTTPSGSTYITPTEAASAASSNNNLNNLVLSAGTITPSFASATTSYTLSVANAVTSTTVTPTVQDSTATVTVNGTSVASGSASGAIPLSVGSNTITTVVTAQNGTTKTYTVTVTRAAAASTNANLNNLVLSAGSISPPFASGTTAYTLSVANSVASTTVTPTVQDSTAAIKVNGTTVASGAASAAIPLTAGGDTTINTVVTAQDGTTTKTYTVVVTRAAAAVNNTTASALTYSGITSSAITVTAPFTGDANGNNSCVIKWNNVNDSTYPNTATTTKSGSAYTATISGLTESTTYYFQATFTDADGITGSPVTGSASTIAFVNPLMHTGANLGTKYSGGTWGAGKDCTWCHGSGSTNIKKIKAQIDTPTGLRNVTFSIISAAKNNNGLTGVFGNDNRTYAVNGSSNICEVCHHQTSYHQYSSTKIAAGSKNHNDANNGDCIECHSHSKGFKGEGAHSIPRYGAAGGHPTCMSGVGCHANTNPAAPYPTIAVNGSYPAPDCRACHKLADPTLVSTGCSSCHGSSNGVPNGNVYPNISGAHTRHVALTQINNNCQYCHDIGGTSGNADHGPNNRVATGTVNLAASLGASGSNNTLVCSNTYCHSDGTNLVTPATHASPTWTGGATNCGSCHGNGAANGSPSYTTGKANSHIQHVTTAGYTCDYCHYKTTSNGTTITSAARHANRFYNISANGAKTMKFTYNGSVCSNSQCHGTGATTSKAWGSNSADTIDTCTKCHGTSSASPATDLQKAPTTPATAAHAIHLSPTIGAVVACTECHESVPVSNTVGHMDGTKTIQYNGPVGTSYTTTPSGTYPTSCGTTWCHGGNTTKLIQNSPARTAPTWGTSFGATNITTVGDGVTTSGTGRCAQCHGFPPIDGNHANVNVDGTGGKTSCNTCHGHVTTTGTFSPVNLHINGVIEGGTCLGCHDTGKSGDTTSRVAIKPQFSAQSHHVQGRAVTDADCYQCHMEASDTSGKPDKAYHVGTANSGAAVNLVVWNGSTRGYVSYTANGKRTSIRKVNDHCLGCHNSTKASATPFSDGYTTDQYSPEQRLATPQPKTSIESRYSSSRTVVWSQYNYSSAAGNVARFGTNQKYRTTKALSAHGKADKNQMPTWSATANGPGEDGNMADYTYAGNSGNRNVFCYDCHNSHGSDATGVTSSYSSATGRYKGGLLKSTVANKGGYTVTYKPAGRDITYRNVTGLGQTAWASTTYKPVVNSTTTYTINPGGSLCNDCHNNDTRKVGTINKPWSITNTYSSSQAIVGYWSTPYFDNYTMASAKRTTYKMGGTANSGINDRRKPMGGHFGSSVSTRRAGHAQEINGLCTPCHDPHGVSNALGASGSGTTKAGQDYGVPLLKGTWVTTPYREDKADKIVVRGGGRNVPYLGALGAVPGYHIDQNTFMVTPAPVNNGASSTATATSNQRRQTFRSFSNNSSVSGTGYPTKTYATFAGLCDQCHNQASLTNGTAASTTTWRSKQRIHQTVAGWAATTGTGGNVSNKVHAFTCSKCHAPHVSRLPRLLVTNCLDARHYGQQVSTTMINSVNSGTTTYGNIHQSTVTSARGAGRFPGGGSRYSGTPSSAQNPGGWWFQTNGAAGTTQPTATPNTTDASLSNQNYGTGCHNAATAGGTTYNPTNQRWNNKTPW